MSYTSNWWQVLQVDQSATLQEIKKAYAKLVKEANYNDDHDLLVNLHTAYAEAKKYLNNDISNKIDIEDYVFEDSFTFDPTNPETLTTYTYDKSFTNTVYYRDHININVEPNAYEECVQILDTVYSNFNRRNKISEWEKLFDNLTLKEEYLVDEYGYRFFNENFNLRKSVWQYVNKRLNLTRNANFVNGNLVKDKVIDEYINYKLLDGLSYLESETFYSNWTNAYLSFIQCDYEHVINFCNFAIELYKNEPYIYKMKMIAEYELNIDEDCLATCTELKEFEKERSDALRYHANILLRQKKYKEAQKLYKEIGKKEGDTVLDKRGVIHCLFKRKKLIRTFLKESTYGNTTDDIYLEYALASRFQKLFVHLGLQKAFNFLDAIRVLLVAAVIIASLITLMIFSFTALIISVPFLVIGVIIYAFVNATKETILEKRAKK